MLLAATKVWKACAKLTVKHGGVASCLFSVADEKRAVGSIGFKMSLPVLLLLVITAADSWV